MKREIARSPSEIATELLVRNLGYLQNSIEIPISINLILEKMNIQVDYKKFKLSSDKIKGKYYGIISFEKDQVKIFLDDFGVEEYKRFYLAMGLGSYLFRGKKYDSNVLNKIYGNKEINTWHDKKIFGFASELLVPSQLLKSHYYNDKIYPYTSYLSGLFKVPPDVIRHQLNKNNLMELDVYTGF